MALCGAKLKHPQRCLAREGISKQQHNTFLIGVTKQLRGVRLRQELPPPLRAKSTPKPSTTPKSANSKKNSKYIRNGTFIVLHKQFCPHKCVDQHNWRNNHLCVHHKVWWCACGSIEHSHQPHLYHHLAWSSANYYVVYPGNTPENHPPTEACMGGAEFRPLGPVASIRLKKKSLVYQQGV